MKTKLILMAGAVALVWSTLLRAEDKEAAPIPEKFRAGELSLDLFGSASVREETFDHLSADRVRKDGRLGAGAGINYFFTHQFGLGADAYTENTKHSLVDNASANAIFRFPFQSIGLAPYIYGGGGHQFDPRDHWFGQGGGGLEVRVTPHWGLFLDGRYVLPDGGKDFGVGRLGVRFAF